MESVIIPDSVTSIGDSAFRSSSITNITIPDSVTSIGDSAFRSSYITSVTIPDNVIIMGEDVFMECCNLYDAQIFGRIDTIGEKVFADCYSLKSVTIPDTVTTIIAGAFEDCDSLETVYYEASGDLTRHNNESLWRAKWIRCYFVKLINEEGELSYIYCLPNEKINISDIKKQYMKEVTLYTDKECSEEFNSQMPITDSMTLYIKLGEEITVIYGDINDDGKITMDDAIHLFNSTMFPEQYSISVGQKTDYNGDDNFDMNDAIYLFNYTMFPEQYPI